MFCDQLYLVYKSLAGRQDVRLYMQSYASPAAHPFVVRVRVARKYTTYPLVRIVRETLRSLLDKFSDPIEYSDQTTHNREIV